MTTSKHRQAAFESCYFIMDYLKTDAPFWKKESTEQKEEWVESRESDDEQKKTLAVLKIKVFRSIYIS